MNFSDCVPVYEHTYWLTLDSFKPIFVSSHFLFFLFLKARTNTFPPLRLTLRTRVRWHWNNCRESDLVEPNNAIFIESSQKFYVSIRERVLVLVSFFFPFCSLIIFDRKTNEIRKLNLNDIVMHHRTQRQETILTFDNFESWLRYTWTV